MSYITYVVYRGILLGGLNRLQNSSADFTFTYTEDPNYGPFLQSVNGVAGSAEARTYWALLVRTTDDKIIVPDVAMCMKETYKTLLLNPVVAHPVSEVTNLRLTGFISFAESISNTTKPTYSLVEDCRLSSEKRKTGTSCESPRKRQKGCGSNTDASEPTEVAVDDVTAKGTKRKASAETETPKEKIQRVEDDDTDTKGSVEKEKSGKKASCEQLPATERKEDSLSSSDPSTSEQEEGSRSTSVASSTESISNTTKPTYSLVEDCRLSSEKRKTSTSCESPRKRQKGCGSNTDASEPTEVAVDDVTAKGTKRKASAETETPKEKIQRVEDDDTDTKGSVEKEKSEKKASCEQLPATERKEDSLSSSDPSTSEQEEGSRSTSVASSTATESGAAASDLSLITDDVGQGSHQTHPKSKGAETTSGTTAFAPPEVYSTKRYMAGPTTVWQLGAVLFELLNECEYFNTPKFISKKLKINRDVSQDCQDFLKMCLDTNPEKRATLQQMQQHPWFTHTSSV
ncbi:hypothetical protein PAMA_020859 [Pampus argenteus]